MRRPILNVQVLNDGILDVLDNEKVIWLVDAAIRPLAVPVRRTIAVDDMARDARDGDVGAGQNNGVKVAVFCSTKGCGACKGKRGAGLQGQAESAGGRSRDAREEDVGAGFNGRRDACVGRYGAVVASRDLGGGGSGKGSLGGSGSCLGSAGSSGCL